MKLLDLLRKGFGYVLMSMGISRPGTRPGTRPAQTAKPLPKQNK
jgi:hypothetical protein